MIFKDYLDSIHKAKSEDEIRSFIYNAAKSLMQEHHVVIAEKYEYDITEIEFYYFNTQTHKDPYVHLHCFQLEFGMWYVHEQGFGRGGIDYTFGDGDNFGGILIREIQDRVSKKYATGPAKVREKFTDLLNSQVDKTHQALQRLLDDSKNIKLSHHFLEEKEIACGKRIGLPKKDFCNAENFQESPYRFASFANSKRTCIIGEQKKSYSVKGIRTLKNSCYYA